MNDDAHGLIERALPKGRVPFHVDGAAVAASGRRIRRRRRFAAAGGIAGAVVLGATVVVFGLGAVPGPGADATGGGAGVRTDQWDASEPWTLTKRDPFTDEASAIATADVSAAFTEVLGASVRGDAEDGGIKLGHYTETSPNGDLDRRLLFGEGRFTVPGYELDTAVEVSVYEQGLVDDPAAFVDCEAEGVNCSDRTGPDGEAIVLATRDTVSGDVTLREYEVYVYRADKTIAKLTAKPSLDHSSEASGLVTVPRSTTELCDLALAFPQDLTI